MAVNYDKMIADATKRIANYYMQKLLNDAGSYSLDTYNYIVNQVKRIQDGATKADWYLHGSWVAYSGPLPDLDLKTWLKLVLPFLHVASEYIKREQASYVGRDEEQAVAKAVKKLYAKIGDNVQPLQKDPRQKPMDFDKTVNDTVTKLADYFDKILAKRASKMSDKEYDKCVRAISALRAGGDTKNTDFYKHFGWMNFNIYDVLQGLDYEVWSAADKFFSMVKCYLEDKAKGYVPYDKTSENNLMVAVKKLNLKLGGRLLEPLREMFLPNGHFISRRDISK